MRKGLLIHPTGQCMEDEEPEVDLAEPLDPADVQSNRKNARIALVVGIILFNMGLPLLIIGSISTDEDRLAMLIPGAAMFSIGVFVVVSTSFVLISSGSKSYAETEKQAEVFETNFAEKLRLSSAETSFEKSSFSRMNTVDSSVPKSEQVAPQERYVFAPEEMTWAEHNERAIAMGGHLACITSAEENEQVTKISGGKTVWIGGIRKGGGNGPGADHWYWSDGRPWSYTNWYPGEPNNMGGFENRVHLGLQAPGTWNDVSEGWPGPAVYQMSETASTESKPPQFTSILGDMEIHEKYKM